MSSDPWDAAAAEDGIAHTRFAGRLHHLPTTTSTSTLALQAASTGYPEGHVWVADEQTAGRGRGGHAWHSEPRAGLYLSALLRPTLSPSNALHLSLATGLAVQAAVAELTGLHPDLRWPNDLLLDTRKCAGILVETAVAAGTLRHAIIGIGLNVAHTAFPPPLADLATSLRLATGRLFPREPLLAAILRHLDREITQLQCTNPDILTRFAAASTWVHGKRVRVGEPPAFTGTTAGLDPRGFLLVHADDGTPHTVLSGGVRPA